MLLKLVGPTSHFEGVWYWDSSAFWISDDEQSLYWLADSFNEFLSMLAYDVCAYEEERETLPLFQAIQRGAITAIEQYLEQGGDVEARNEQGHTLLMAAAWHQWPKIVRLLLEPFRRSQRARQPRTNSASSCSREFGRQRKANSCGRRRCDGAGQRGQKRAGRVVLPRRSNPASARRERVASTPHSLLALNLELRVLQVGSAALRTVETNSRTDCDCHLPSTSFPSRPRLLSESSNEVLSATGRALQTALHVLHH